MLTTDRIRWLSDERLTIGDIEFNVVPVGRSPSTPGRFVLLKNRDIVDAYVDFAACFDARNVVELGIFEGGSTALLELLLRPEKMVAFELATERVAALDEFLRRQGAAERVFPYYGVNQADSNTIVPIVRKHFGSAQLDLVIDDASHDLEFTRQSFNLLFPLLREGGVYVIEDWGWGHFQFARERRGPSLAKLVLQLALSLPYSQNLINDLSLDRYWAIVRRGSAGIDANGFDLSDHISSRGRQLLATTDEDPRFRRV